MSKYAPPVLTQDESCLGVGGQKASALLFNHFSVPAIVRSDPPDEPGPLELLQLPPYSVRRYAALFSKFLPRYSWVVSSLGPSSWGDARQGVHHGGCRCTRRGLPEAGRNLRIGGQALDVLHRQAGDVGDFIQAVLPGSQHTPGSRQSLLLQSSFPAILPATHLHVLVMEDPREVFVNE